jgi:hypothetical protein
VLLLLSIPSLALALIFLSIGLDIQGQESLLYYFSKALDHPDHYSLVSLVQMMGIMCCGELGLICTTSIIVLQMASTRFTPHVAKLFFSDPYIVCGLAFYVILNIYVTWLALAVAGHYEARWAICLLIILFSISLAITIPFFMMLFFFVNPKKVIEKIMEEGVKECIDTGANHIVHRQNISIDAIERLSYFSLHTLTKQDIALALYSVDALCSFAITYGETKNRLNPQWHVINAGTRGTSDYFTLSDRAITQLESKRTWVEFKILKQYQCLFEKSLITFRALGFRVCLDTRDIAEHAPMFGDIHTFDLCTKFMNTFIRKAVNLKDINMVCGCFHQYRQMGEYVIINSNVISKKCNLPLEEVFERAIHITKCLRYYSHLCIDKDMGFVAKVATFDISIILKHCVLKDFALPSEHIMDTFLSMSVRNNVNNLTLQGILYNCFVYYYSMYIINIFAHIKESARLRSC